MLGITLLPEYIQSEGIEPLLDNLIKRAPVTAISTSPYVMSELPAEQGGTREPPADAEKGLVRLLDRPLWGKREVWIETAPSFEPNLKFYEDLRYQPSKPTALTRSEGPIVDTFIEAVQARGIKIYFQIQSAIPPGYRVQFGGPIEDDTPRLPDGSIPSQRLDKNGSLASPHIIEYGEALIKDLLQRYPTIDGIRIDWPEYPPYFLDSIFIDFGPHVANFASERGFDFERIREEAAASYKRFRESLTDADLKSYIQSPQKLISDLQVSDDFVSLKSQIVSNLLLRYRNAMNEAGGERKELIPSAFPEPWNRLSGFDYTANSKIVDAISCKHYTMHWPMMMMNYNDALTEKNPKLTDSLVAESLSKSFGAVSPTPSSTEGFFYPDPHEKHPVSLQELGKKQTIAEMNSTNAPVLPIAHSYGPTEDFAKRAEAVYSVSKKRLWVNRYAYLSDDKLDALGRIFQ